MCVPILGSHLSYPISGVKIVSCYVVNQIIKIANTVLLSDPLFVF